MKRLLLILLLLLGLAQFIRPDTSVPAHDPAQDLIALTKPSPAVEQLLRAACYDCHSYETNTTGTYSTSYIYNPVFCYTYN